MIAQPILYAALAGACLASPVEKRAALPPKVSVKSLGVQTSNFPNEFRDGGGGANIKGVNVIWYSDGDYTNDGKPPNQTSHNTVSFISNSIAYSGQNGQPITRMTDFGSSSTGPRNAIPFVGNEDGGTIGIWPNEPITTLGDLGVSFVQVINRTLFQMGKPDNIYNTPVQINITENGPVATRPVQKLFLMGEPQYGTFSSFAGIDGYLYSFAAISGTNGTSDGLKMARVLKSNWYDRSQYTYWNGHAWSNTIPAYNDGGAANIFNFTRQVFGGSYFGPNTGNVFYSPVYGVYLMLLQQQATAFDSTVYLAYSKTNNIEDGFVDAVGITQLNSTTGGQVYSFNAYPNYDPTGKVIPISWSSAPSSTNGALSISMSNITFS